MPMGFMEGIFNRKPQSQEVDAVDPKHVAMLKEAMTTALVTPEEKTMIDTPEKLDDMTKRVLGYLKAHGTPLSEELIQSAEFVDALEGALKVTPTAPGYAVADQEGLVLGIKESKAQAEAMIRDEKLGRGREGGGADA